MGTSIFDGLWDFVVARFETDAVAENMHIADERHNEAYRAQLARADHAEAEVVELRQKLSDCELLLTALGKTHTRVSGERDELRATVDAIYREVQPYRPENM